MRKDNGDHEWLNQYFETEEMGVEPILGFMWSPLSRLSFGLSLRRTHITSSETDTQVNCNTDIPTSPNPACLTNGTVNPADPPGPLFGGGTARRELPWEVGLGVAFFHSPRLLLSMDGYYYTGPDDEFQNRDPTWNLAAGMEYYLNEVWALRGGLYTNRSNTPEIESGGINQSEHVNYLGGSLSLTRFTRNSSISAGFNYSRGTGKAQVIHGTTDIQDVSAETRLFYLSTSYAF